MLAHLSIRDIVLIDKLTLSLAPGLCVLTGETGAGKSILMDALGLALGARADSSLIRLGAEKAVVTAVFDLTDSTAIDPLLEEQGLDPVDGQLILRRVLTTDGKSRGFVNDQPVSIGFLRQLGDRLAEVHGQHDERGLLDPKGHRALLDAFGDLDGDRAAVAGAWRSYELARSTFEARRAGIERSRQDEEYHRHMLSELDGMSPKTGEEEALSQTRAMMMQGEKLGEELDHVHSLLTEDEGVDAVLRSVVRRLGRMDSVLRERLEQAMAALERAAIEAAEGIAQIEQIQSELEFDPASLEQTEERLFALRELARKHRCGVDDLPAVRDDIAEKIADLEKGENDLVELQRAKAAAGKAFTDAVRKLTRAREKAAEALDRAVSEELAPLKLDKARFRTRLSPIAETDWGPAGGEQVRFEVATNSGAPFGPLIKIASGGELARFVLALKVSLARRGSAPTLVFDEVDRGVGGATAEAVGVRLGRLSRDAQVLVVTHSPQVAACADHHWRISKRERGDGKAAKAITEVTALDDVSRREEIARMLSGARITEEARAAADSLMARSV